LNICLFFEGTGQGVAGKITNVTRLRDLCVDDTRQKLHLEPGPGTHFGSYLGAPSIASVAIFPGFDFIVSAVDLGERIGRLPV